MEMLRIQASRRYYTKGLYGSRQQKIALTQHLLKGRDLKHVLIFCSTKKSVKELTRSLIKANLSAHDIHSDLEQEEREKVLLDFKNKKVKILVATDILSRGIDI